MVVVMAMLCTALGLGDVCLAAPPQGECDTTVSVEVTYRQNGILFSVSDSASGQPITGATVKERMDGADWVLAPGTTDENGCLFRVMPMYIQPHNFEYVVSAQGYIDSEIISIAFRKGNLSQAVGLERSVIPADFFVTDEMGAPVAGVQISITRLPQTDTGAGQEAEHCLTDQNGYASCNLEDAEYSYTLAHAWFEDSSGSMTIDHTEGERHTEHVSVRHKAFCVDFMVLDENGNPVQGAAVSMDGKTVTTGADGRAVFENIFGGTYSFRVEHVGYEAYAGSVDVPQKEQDGLVIRMKKLAETAGLGPKTGDSTEAVTFLLTATAAAFILVLTLIWRKKATKQKRTKM